LPVIIGRKGVVGFLQAEFTPEEIEGLHNSARIVMETYQQIEG
jgi:malate/lactate dehydrogenase